MSNEDKRTAVGFSITLSSSIIAATVAILAIQASYAAYALGSRETRAGFALVGALAAASLVLSVIFAGKGVTKTRNKGFEGDWDLRVGKPYFNKQAGLCLLGLLLFGVSLTFSGPSKETALHKEIESAESELAELRSKVDVLTKGHGAQEEEIESIKTDVNTIKANIEPDARDPSESKGQ